MVQMCMRRKSYRESQCKKPNDVKRQVQTLLQERKHPSNRARIKKP